MGILIQGLWNGNEGEEVIDNSSLNSSTTWNKESWMKKYLPSFLDLFDITINYVDNDGKENMMYTAWDKADLGKGREASDEV